ncbi:MAG: 2TM domain-containing protein [Rhodothermales bacterium]|nr:2TM domain-containing protein [Rhodothermales bacterium]
MMTRREAKGVLSTFKDRMEDLKRFYLHAAGFLATNAVFITINLAVGPHAGPIAMLPLIAWTPVLVIHARRVFGQKGSKTREWEERMIYELMHGEEMPEGPITLAQAMETLKLSASAEPDSARLQKRIEHLEAIITSEQWESPADLELDGAPVKRKQTVR